MPTTQDNSQDNTDTTIPVPTKNELIDIQAALLVSTNSDTNKHEIRRYASALKTTQKRLREACIEYRASLHHPLTENEVHVIYRTAINKLTFIINTPSIKLLPGEYSRLINVLNTTVQSYRELFSTDEQAEQDNNTVLLNALLEELYSSEEGIALLERVSSSINN